MAKTKINPRYIGDGVYVHDEGFQLALSVNHHNNKVVYLDKSTLLSLIEYAKEVKLIK